MSHEFFNAYFTNDERTVVEVQYIDPQDPDNLYIEHVKADKKQKMYQDLLEIVTEDQLHENTYKHMRVLSESFQSEVIEIAKEQGLVYDIDDLNSQLYEVLFRSIFADFDEEEHKEKLFLIKIALFENEEIMKSNEKALKTKLRKSNSLLEAVHYATEIVLKSRAKDTSATTQPAASPAAADSSDTQETQDTPAEQSETTQSHTNKTEDSDESTHVSIDQFQDDTLTDSNQDSNPIG